MIAEQASNESVHSVQNVNLSTPHTDARVLPMPDTRCPTQPNHMRSPSKALLLLLLRKPCKCK